MKGATPAITELLRAGVAFTPREYAHDPSVDSYGREAAEALGMDARRVFKTLMVADDHDPRRLAVGIVPVSTTLNLKSMARALRVKKVSMAPVAVAEKSSGYVAGGISPLGQRRKLPTIIESTALQWPTILVSGGQRGLDVELSPRDLADLTDATFREISERDTSLNRSDS